MSVLTLGLLVLVSLMLLAVVPMFVVIRKAVEESPFAICVCGPNLFGLRYFAVSYAWLVFHDLDRLYTPATARWLSHPGLNPEVANNKFFRAVHRRVSRGGEPEGNDWDTYGDKRIHWVCYNVGFLCLSMGARFAPEKDAHPEAVSVEGSASLMAESAIASIRRIRDEL